MVIERTARGIPMRIDVVNANGAKSARITCPPEGPLEVSFKTLRFLGAFRPDDFDSNGRTRHHRIERVAELFHVSTKTVHNSLTVAQDAYKTGTRPTPPELRAEAERLGLLDPQTIATIERVVGETKSHGNKRSRREND